MYYLSSKWTLACFYHAFDRPRAEEKEMPANRCNHFILCPLVPKRNRQQQRKIRACSFRHLNFFRLFLNTFVKHVSLTPSLACSLRVRPGLIRGNVCLYRPKKHFNDTRISSLFTIIRAMNKRKKERARLMGKKAIERVRDGWSMDIWCIQYIFRESVVPWFHDETFLLKSLIRRLRFVESVDKMSKTYNIVSWL